MGLVQICDLDAALVLFLCTRLRKAILSGYISEIQFSNSFTIRGFIIQNIYFNLTCILLQFDMRQLDDAPI